MAADSKYDFCNVLYYNKSGNDNLICTLVFNNTADNNVELIRIIAKRIIDDNPNNIHCSVPACPHPASRICAMHEPYVELISEAYQVPYKDAMCISAANCLPLLNRAEESLQAAKLSVGLNSENDNTAQMSLFVGAIRCDNIECSTLLVNGMKDRIDLLVKKIVGQDYETKLEGDLPRYKCVKCERVCLEMIECPCPIKHRICNDEVCQAALKTICIQPIINI